MSSNKKEKPKKVNLGIIGEESDVDKLIDIYLPSCQGVTTNKENIILEKRFNDIKYNLNVYKVTQKNSKYFDILDICHEAVIVIDLTNRQSFDKLLDNWILWLRDDCRFEKKTMLLGLTNTENEIVINKEEINNILMNCEMQIDYLDLSVFKDDDDKNTNLDDAFFSKLDSAELDDLNEGLSKKDCLIY